MPEVGSGIWVFGFGGCLTKCSSNDSLRVRALLSLSNSITVSVFNSFNESESSLGSDIISVVV